MASETADFSAELDKLWNYGKPAESQARFKTGLARYPAKAHALLRDDAHMKASEAARLARLDSIAQGKPP